MSDDTNAGAPAPENPNPLSPPANPKPARRPRSDRGKPRPKKDRKSKYLKMLVNIGKIVHQPDEGEPEVEWEKACPIPSCSQDEARAALNKILNDPERRDLVANKRIQIMAILDEFTLEVETTVRGRIVR